MKKSWNTIAFLFTGLLSLVSIETHAGVFNNSGVFSSGKKYSSKADVFSNTGQVLAGEAIDLACNVLKGNGLFRAPIIVIVAKTFEFTGVFDFTEECTIITEKPINSKSFTCKGGGKLTLQVDESLFEKK